MRTIDRTNTFKRDYRRISTMSRYSKNLDGLLLNTVALLAEDRPLSASHRDHALKGNWLGFRDCHLRPDLVLVYAKPDASTLRLSRLGSHSDLFG